MHTPDLIKVAGDLAAWDRVTRLPTPIADARRLAWGQPGMSAQSTIGHAMGNWVGQGLESLGRRSYWGDAAPWKGALQFGTLGGLGGAAASAAYNQVAPWLGTRTVSPWVAGALSSLLGAYFGHTRGQNLSSQRP